MVNQSCLEAGECRGWIGLRNLQRIIKILSRFGGITFLSSCGDGCAEICQIEICQDEGFSRLDR